MAQRAISNRTSILVLEGILFEAKDQHLTLIATDFDLSIITKTSCDVIEEGSIVLNSSLIGNIVRKLPDDTVYIKAVDGKVQIRCGNALFELISLDPSEYPALPVVDASTSFSLPGELMAKVIKYTLFSVSADESRPTTMGVLMETDADSIHFVSLDGYRLSRARLPYENPDPFTVIVPSRTISELNRIMDVEQDLTFCQEGGTILFEFGNTKLYSRLIEGRFIDYKGILGTKYHTYTTVNRHAFIDALDRMSLLAREDKAKLVKMAIGRDSIEMQSNTELGNVYEKIACETEGEDLNIAFNTRYISDGAKIIETEKIRINLKGPVDPCTVVPVEDELDYTHLVLPVKLKNEVIQ